VGLYVYSDEDQRSLFNSHRKNQHDATL